MSKHCRNKSLKNSKGISKREYLLGTNAGQFRNRELNKDFDYLKKLSPEELAWLAEFQFSVTTGSTVDPEIVGEENAAKMNSKEWKRESYHHDNNRRRKEIYNNRQQTFKEMIDFVSDSYTDMLDDIEESINKHWQK